MQKNRATENSTGVVAEKRTIRQRLTGNRWPAGIPLSIKLLVGVVAAAIVTMLIFLLYTNVPVGGEPGAAIDFPKEWDFGWDAIKWIDGKVDWVIIN